MREYAPVEIATLPRPSFDHRLVTIANFLPPEDFAAIAAAIEILPATERSYLPTHKKGGAISYNTLMQHAPAVVSLYRSSVLHGRISDVVGVHVVPTPDHDQSSCSVLCYERPGDHIAWHYDHNFYRGRHFTVLMPIVNRNCDGSELSAARLIAKINGADHMVPTPPNTVVVFEGAKILHKATPIHEGERRILLSMTFTTDPRNTIPKEIARRVKDTAFFGLRALWT
jgi:hypothetical protein